MTMHAPDPPSLEKLRGAVDSRVIADARRDMTALASAVIGWINGAREDTPNERGLKLVVQWYSAHMADYALAIPDSLLRAQFTGEAVRWFV